MAPVSLLKFQQQLLFKKPDIRQLVFHPRYIHAGFNKIEDWDLPSPRKVTAVVWHSMEGYIDGAISRWNSGVAGAHLCIIRSGEIIITVDLNDVAFHAGTSASGDTLGRTQFWRTHNINPYSIGIELEGYHDSAFSNEQIQSAKDLALWITKHYPVPPEHTYDQIAGHHKHSELSAMRSDPGNVWPLDSILQYVKENL